MIQNIKICTMSLMLSLGLSSCLSEEIPSDTNSESGTTTLAVDLLRPQSTRAVSTVDFPVVIRNAATNEVVNEYSRADQVPQRIKLAVGNYLAESHTPGELQKVMDYPYYAGKQEFQILQAVNTNTTVTCRMANGSFQMKYAEDFRTSFSAWNISITDGSETILTFTHEDDESKVKYLAFEEGVQELSVEFVGTTTSGNRINMKSKLTKAQASEQYDNDDQSFSGGDAIVIQFNPTAITDGDVTGITINANISFEETEESISLEVTDKETTVTPDPGTGGENEPQTDAITLALPANMTVAFDTDPSLGDTQISCERGIKSIQVKMTSTSADMMASLSELAINYPSANFIQGAEVVGNQEMVQLFTDLGQELSVPNEGDLSYTFPIGNFFVLLSVLPGDHTFELTVTDMDGTQKSGELVLTVEE